MPAEYLFRLDDACPTSDADRWEAVLKVLSQRGVRPIVAIIPANGDPALAAPPADSDFWERARSWAGAGCMIALHGFSHVMRPSHGGLVPVQRRSEFVGLPIDEQRRRIREGVRFLEANGIVPEAWVAPAHGLFQRFTNWVQPAFNFHRSQWRTVPGRPRHQLRSLLLRWPPPHGRPQ